jgi:hypothetical protein
VQWAWIFDMPAERIRDAFKTGELSEQSVESEFSMDPEGKTAFVRMGIGRKHLSV